MSVGCNRLLVVCPCVCCLLFVVRGSLFVVCVCCLLRVVYCLTFVVVCC